MGIIALDLGDPGHAADYPPLAHLRPLLLISEIRCKRTPQLPITRSKRRRKD